jgi:GNAT superfamily N-acetyltransferase
MRDMLTCNHSLFNVRPLCAEDSCEIEQLLKSLDIAARCARFGWACNDAALARHSDKIVAHSTHAIGAFVNYVLVGLLELYREPIVERIEAALVLEARWRRKGIGGSLLNAAISWADVNEVTTIRLIFARHNWPMRRLVASANAQLDLAFDEICADIAVGQAR